MPILLNKLKNSFEIMSGSVMLLLIFFKDSEKHVDVLSFDY